MQITKSLLLLSLAVVFCPACHKESAKPAPPAPSSTKSISSFLLEKGNNPNTLDADVAGFITGDTIALSIPAQSSLTQLIPTILITGKTIQPSSGSPQDFSKPVTYTVTAEDGSTQNYTVIVNYRRTLYFTDGYGQINACNGLNGQPYWSFKTDTRILSAPTAGAGKVFFIGVDGLYAVNALTGALLWKVSVPNTGYADFTLGVPMLAGGVVYGSFVDGTIRAVDASTGQVKWIFRTAAPFYSSPTVYNNHVFAGNADSCLYAVDATTGGLQWKFKGGGPIIDNPLVMNNVVFAGDFGYPHFYALGADNGGLLWDAGIYIQYSSPVGLNGTIYADELFEQLMAINPTTGGATWLLQPPYGYEDRGSLYLADGAAFLASLDGYVYAYNLKTPQSPLWKFTGGTYFYSSTVVCKGIVYIGDVGGKLYGLSTTDGSIKMTTQAYGPSSVCIVDENGVTYHPAESGEY